MNKTQIIKRMTADWNRLFYKGDPGIAWGNTNDRQEVYAEGDLSAILDPERPRIVIVGTRDLRGGEESYIINIISHLADNPTRPIIISGLAYGTDTLVHKYALQFSLPTIAVMATGLDEIYPFRNSQLAEIITTTKECALLTQFPEHTAPETINFLERNKTMAALADAVIVPFTKARGGAVVTAKMAYDFGRQVYALPGRVDDINSTGCNALIRDGIADILSLPERLKLPEMFFRERIIEQK